MTPEPWQGGELGEQQEGVFDLSALADELLAAARNDLQRKASRLVIHGTTQRAVLMAILAGGGLAEHASPPAATLHVLRGRIRLYAGDAAEWFVSAGQVVAIPPERHSVDALEDSAFLLTVALAN
ncbi:MAG: cupin domain-containing protein [Tetrasphaera jenkinsii]|jgi:quercetin dioxygenase-like cupin family protein|nr:cupin domain-containing protein [Tetrasphaera jenkinsii]